MINTVNLRQIQSVLMEPNLEKHSGQKVKSLTNGELHDFAYFTFSSPNTEENLTFILAGKNGLEFNKTMGFAYRFPGVLIYKCIYGQGILAIQKNDELGEAKEFRVVGLRPGVEVEIPSGYCHTLINTGKGFLVTIDNGAKEDKYRDSDGIQDKHGLSYYVIDKKGEIGFEKNLNYTFHPQITS